MASIRNILKSYRCSDPNRAWEQLREWYETPLGRLWYEQEAALLTPVLSNLFGYHLLQVGAPTDRDLLAGSRIKHRMVLEADPGRVGRRGAAERCIAPLHQLPIASDSLDVVVLAHSLELAEGPHQLLREVERTLIAEGHVVILGFNPVGWWGLGRLTAGWCQRPPWCAHFFTLSRIRDWLALLGFDTVVARGYFYRPPWQHPALLERLRFFDRLSRPGWSFLAGGHLLVAKKRVATLTPLKPRWRPRRSLIANGLAKPTLNNNRTCDRR